MKTRKKNKRVKKINMGSVLVKLLLCISVIVIAAYGATGNSKPSSKEVSTKVEASNTENTSVEEVKSSRNDKIKIPVICYHSINKDPSGKSPIIISPEKFRQHLKAVKDNGYTTLTMAQFKEYILGDKPVPEKSVLITFDDGYMDNYTNAFPILKEFNMNATIFVISSYLDGKEYLSPSSVKEMSDYGIDIESHTVSHRRLSELSYEEQLSELKNSKETLEKLTGKPVFSIAYPEGKYNDDTIKAVSEAGYSMGFTIDRGYVGIGDNPDKLYRMCVDYTYKPYNIEKILNQTAK
ncbi:polysaccharide deacetylase family protein [Clostridium sp. C2-6-12]|uniref:polysaccharide deacetylase family protein n=1 Tax=Clostridium sp. C2-6-12 TaxID=2698832 RepID=UPI00136DD571|nr:polysaccharide deacetylase family protein [Clostridium sp. C2-6-12]